MTEFAITGVTLRSRMQSGRLPAAEAIALATIAEIQACCEGKLGASRRMTARMVAEMLEAGGAERYVHPCPL